MPLGSEWSNGLRVSGVTVVAFCAAYNGGSGGGGVSYGWDRHLYHPVHMLLPAAASHHVHLTHTRLSNTGIGDH